MCRKIVESDSFIEVWGDGLQTRSFLFIDECLLAIEKFMDSDFSGPINIGSEEMVTINNLAEQIINISGKKLTINNLFGTEFKEKYGYDCPQGVRGRSSNNDLFHEKIGWKVQEPLSKGLGKTYEWIKSQVN